MDFAEWLQKELNKRGWSHSELARYSGVSPGQISRFANGSRGAGPDLCIAIAKGLGLARSEVFQARGWLVSYPEDPYGPEIDVRAEQLAKNVSALPLNIREAALDAMEPVLTSVIKVSKQAQET
jgi:transcriptional regulator with XRE-family HTH domain